MSKIPLYIPTMFFVFFALLGAGMSLHVWRIWSLHDGVHTQGTVVDKRVEQSQDDRGSITVSHVVYYEYHHDGWPYRGRAHVKADTFEKIELGSPVPVVYHPDHPGRSSPGKAPPRIPLFPAAAAAVGNLTALGLLVAIVGALRRGGKFLDSK